MKTKYVVKRREGDSWTVVVFNCQDKPCAIAVRDFLQDTNPAGEYAAFKVETTETPVK